MTGRDLVTASLRLIGAIAPGESLSASEATDGLAAINRMIDSWSNESLLIYATVRDEFTLVPGTQSYTYGTGATFNSARPQTINEAVLRNDSTSPALDYQLNILSEAEWAAIAQKETSGSIPTDIYLEGSYPYETVHVYPNPTNAYKIVFFALKPITSITTLDTAISLPPGYERALIFNGAVELSAEYGRQPNDLVFNIATDSKAILKRMNHKVSHLRVDSALIGNSRFDIISGDYR